MQPNEDDNVHSWVAPRPAPRMKPPISARGCQQAHFKVAISEPARISEQVKRHFASVSSAHGLNQSVHDVPLPTLPPHCRVTPLAAGSREHVGLSPWVPTVESGFRGLQWSNAARQPDAADETGGAQDSKSVRKTWWILLFFLCFVLLVIQESPRQAGKNVKRLLFALLLQGRSPVTLPPPPQLCAHSCGASPRTSSSRASPPTSTYERSPRPTAPRADHRALRLNARRRTRCATAPARSRCSRYPSLRRQRPRARRHATPRRRARV